MNRYGTANYLTKRFCAINGRICVETPGFESRATQKYHTLEEFLGGNPCEIIYFDPNENSNSDKTTKTWVNSILTLYWSVLDNEQSFPGVVCRFL